MERLEIRFKPYGLRKYTPTSSFHVPLVGDFVEAFSEKGAHPVKLKVTGRTWLPTSTGLSAVELEVEPAP